MGHSRSNRHYRSTSYVLRSYHSIVRFSGIFCGGRRLADLDGERGIGFSVDENPDALTDIVSFFLWRLTRRGSPVVSFNPLDFPMIGRRGAIGTIARNLGLSPLPETPCVDLILQRQDDCRLMRWARSQGLSVFRSRKCDSNSEPITHPSRSPARMPGLFKVSPQGRNHSHVQCSLNTSKTTTPLGLQAPHKNHTKQDGKEC